ncbi:MAG: aminoacyl-tRNA hydrolase [Eggerthellaceae bacterium]|nr:aminoacyl-tRNA hydrolase [Eggerthellaceae bacterium]
MYVVVGLGNPGEEYANTRHNAGFAVVDALGEEAGARYWKSEGGALAAKGVLAGIDVVLAKPQSFMNLSGGPVKNLCNAYGVSPDHVIVIHDDLDIEPCHIRVKKGGGSAGHNGLKSITDKLQTPDYLRVRVGIGRPPGRMPAADFVLAPIRKDALDDFVEGCMLAARAVPYLIEHGLEEAQQKFN